MSQFQKGTVRVLSANATVRHIYEINYITGGSAYAAGETVTWGADGSGKFVREDVANKKLYFYRESGAQPVVTNVVTGAVEVRTIDTLAASSPPDYDNVSTGISQGDVFVVQFQGVTYFVSGTINDDNFDLTATYGETTQNEAVYAVTRDFTPFFSFPTTEVGDIEAVTVVKKALNLIDTKLKQLGYNEQAITSSGGTATIDWKLGNKAAIALTEAVTLTFTAPLGPAIIHLRVTQPASWVITWPASVKWQIGGGAPSISGMTATEVGIIQFYYDGTNYYGRFELDYIA